MDERIPAPVLDPVDGTVVTLPGAAVVDETAAFRPAILGVRGATTAVTVVLCSGAFADADWGVIAWAVVVLTYNIVRILQPVRIQDDTASLLRVLGEVAIHVLAVAATGYWSSPFVFSLLTAIMVAGFARGFGFAVRVGAGSVIAVALPYLLTEGATTEALRTSLQWTTLLLLVAAVAGYARHINVEADRQHSLALDRLGRLSDANTLLFALHRVAQSLPSSLDLDDVLDSTIRRVEDLFTYDVAAVLLLDETGGGWRTVRSEGSRIPSTWVDRSLPAPAAQAARTGRLVHEPDLARAPGTGLGVESRCGLYAPLVGRERVIGLVAVEHTDADHFSGRDSDLLDGFVAPAALAIDNALWFSRLRTVGADEERTRIARDLHDRIGQSLAYLAFELDRIVKADGRGDPVGPALERLRADVRGVIGEVRDTLYDLRTDVSEQSDLPTTLRDYVERVEGRSRLDLRLDLKVEARLPLRQEREVFRIAQEALTNVERHSGAERCLVRWWCEESGALLEVRDDGRGFAAGKDGRLDSYGLLGMRERAASIGATLDVDTVEGVGTTIRCHVTEAAPA
ncbi:GAF domain-containing sensor histidine kinase [Iamia majanohamensis]|uniref:GAF domain-containing sensor histidine kinase n=1 Tax=Iamia majanohamensis TaxID=467976 RepID=A0AAE9YJ59_9ACTN|nr:GAF domain-containing sensor histidine kinase [Iamia majanohamensis]WCO69071.1 GAF domain-containing sensor histidine kinase [Iamia majanohamensis]